MVSQDGSQPIRNSRFFLKCKCCSGSRLVCFGLNWLSDDATGRRVVAEFCDFQGSEIQEVAPTLTCLLLSDPHPRPRPHSWMSRLPGVVITEVGQSGLTSFQRRILIHSSASTPVLAQRQKVRSGNTRLETNGFRHFYSLMHHKKKVSLSLNKQLKIHLVKFLN